MIVYSPMGSGMLTGAHDPRADRAARPTTTGASTTRASASRSCRATSRSSSACGGSPSGTTRRPGAVAVAWTLRNPAVDGAIVGFRRPDQVDPILAAANLELTDAGPRRDQGDGE